MLIAVTPLQLSMQNDLTPLHMAAQGDHDRVAKLLLTAGAPVDCISVVSDLIARQLVMS